MITLLVIVSALYVVATTMVAIKDYQTTYVSGLMLQMISVLNIAIVFLFFFILKDSNLALFVVKKSYILASAVFALIGFLINIIGDFEIGNLKVDVGLISYGEDEEDRIYLTSLTDIAGIFSYISLLLFLFVLTPGIFYVSVAVLLWIWASMYIVKRKYNSINMINNIVDNNISNVEQLDTFLFHGLLKVIKGDKSVEFEKRGLDGVFGNYLRLKPGHLILGGTAIIFVIYIVLSVFLYL